jgi:hypothetical protein
MDDLWKDSRWSEEQELGVQYRAAIRILTCPKRVCARMRACKEKNQPSNCPGFARAGPDPAAESRDRLAAFRAILKRVVDTHEADGEEAWQAELKVWKAADERRAKLAWEKARAVVRAKGRAKSIVSPAPPHPA